MELIQRHIQRQGKALFSQEEVNGLVLRARKGDVAARNAIIEFNLRMLVQLCFRYQSTTSFYARIEMDDIFQEGVFGMIRAIELFDVTKGFTFSTYAYAWIHQSMRRYIDNTKFLVRVPIFAVAIQKQFQKLEVDYGGRDEDFYIKLLAFENDMSEQGVRNALHFRGDGIVSMHAKVNEDGEPEEMQLESLTWEPEMAHIDAIHIQKMAKLLGERDNKVLMLRMENYSLWSIAEMMGMSRENVRLIEKSALIKLRAMVNKVKKGEDNGRITIDAGKEVHKGHAEPGGGDEDKRFFSPDGLGKTARKSDHSNGSKLPGAVVPGKRATKRKAEGDIHPEDAEQGPPVEDAIA